MRKYPCGQRIMHLLKRSMNYQDFMIATVLIDTSGYYHSFSIILAISTILRNSAMLISVPYYRVWVQ